MSKIATFIGMGRTKHELENLWMDLQDSGKVEWQTDTEPVLSDLCSPDFSNRLLVVFFWGINATIPD